jgi:AbrB family looped-hinge helix DNA binding protein
MESVPSGSTRARIKETGGSERLPDRKNPLGKSPATEFSEISDCNPTCGRALADGRVNGNLYAMTTTIDHAGRLVIPKDIRRESGIKPGMPLEVRWEKGAIAITPAPLPVKLERKGRLLVAVPTEGAPRLSADTVERTRKALRKERSGAST